MASSRSVLKPTKAPKPLKRKGPITDAEKAIVAQVVMDQPAEVTPVQVTALAKALRRSPDQIKALVEEARENFVESAKDYVRIHKRAVEEALATGDAKALEVAVKGSQWALEHINAGGARIVEKAAAGPDGTRIMVGIKIGGIDSNNPSIKLITEE